MSESQFIGIYITLLLTMLILEICLLSICDHLKSIKKLLSDMRERREDDCE